MPLQSSSYGGGLGLVTLFMRTTDRTDADVIGRFVILDTPIGTTSVNSNEQTSAQLRK
jgi:hypothetical protein